MLQRPTRNTHRSGKIIVGIFLSIGLILLAFTILQHRTTASFSGADSTLTAEGAECLGDNRCRSPYRLIRLAEHMSAGSIEDARIAKKLIEKALIADDLQPGAWALHSYLETKIAGVFTDAAAESLRKSVKICPLCNNQNLLQWRLQYVLHNWGEVPEDLRTDVFAGADLLRWWYLDHDFLGQQERYAAARNIPYLEYRASINTPYRPEEIQLPN